MHAFLPTVPIDCHSDFPFLGPVSYLLAPAWRHPTILSSLAQGSTYSSVPRFCLKVLTQTFLFVYLCVYVGVASASRSHKLRLYIGSKYGQHWLKAAGEDASNPQSNLSHPGNSARFTTQRCSAKCCNLDSRKVNEIANINYTKPMHSTSLQGICTLKWSDGKDGKRQIHWYLNFM